MDKSELIWSDGVGEANLKLVAVNSKKQAVMTKLVIFGSWNDDVTWAVQAVRSAVAAGAEVICQTGNLGDLSSSTPNGFGDVLNDALKSAGIPLIFCRGIQDDLALLDLPVEVAGYRRVRSNIWLLEAGIQISGVTIAAIGGGTSTDPDEQLSATIVSRDTVLGYRGMAGAPSGADILISHESPQSRGFGGQLPELSGDRYFAAEHEIDQLLIDQVRHYLQPTFHAFGRYESRTSFAFPPHDHEQAIQRLESLGGPGAGNGLIYDSVKNSFTDLDVGAAAAV